MISGIGYLYQGIIPESIGEILKKQTFFTYRPYTETSSAQHPQNKRHQMKPSPVITSLTPSTNQLN